MPAARHQGRGAPCGESFWHWALGADGGHGHAQPPFRSSRLIGAERQPTSDCRQSLQQSPNEGRQEAKLKGIKFGRRRTVDRNVVLTLHQKGTGATEIAHQLSIARSTVYKILEDERAS